MVGSGADLLDGNGLNYAAGNPQELAARIRELTEDEARRTTMRRRSLEIIKQWHFQGTVAQLQNCVHFLERKN
jgi:glycosyltransferase involved in cell wall biosynthesis